jgi:hypothetical protein
MRTHIALTIEHLIPNALAHHLRLKRRASGEIRLSLIHLRGLKQIACAFPNLSFENFCDPQLASRLFCTALQRFCPLFSLFRKTLNKRALSNGNTIVHPFTAPFIFRLFGATWTSGFQIFPSSVASELL